MILICNIVNAKNYHLLVQGLRLCCVELWHIAINTSTAFLDCGSGIDNKVPQLHATQSKPLD